MKLEISSIILFFGLASLVVAIPTSTRMNNNLSQTSSWGPIVDDNGLEAAQNDHSQDVDFEAIGDGYWAKEGLVI